MSPLGIVEGSKAFIEFGMKDGRAECLVELEGQWTPLMADIVAPNIRKAMHARIIEQRKKESAQARIITLAGNTDNEVIRDLLKPKENDDAAD